MDEYLPGDEFDWDQSDDSQHCIHGTFIGSWWGPDLLCGWCEDGISLDGMHRAIAERTAREEHAREENYDRLIASLAVNAFTSTVHAQLIRALPAIVDPNFYWRAA